MRTLKKLLILVMVTAFALISLNGCIEAKAYNPSDESLFNFTLLEDGTYAISAKDASTISGVINLPKTYQGKAVSQVADEGFMGAANITELCVPSSYKVIGVSAFENLTGLTKLYLFKGIVEIKTGAFLGCNGVTSLNLPSTLVTIGESAFAGLSITRLQITEKVKTIGKNAFAYCSSLNNIYISHSVEEIGENAFIGVSSAVEFEISASNEYYKLDQNGYPVKK